MSTYTSSTGRSGAAPAPFAEEKIKSQLDELARLPENRTCMDCGSRDPRWASVNLGIFLCIRCAGAHRCLGTHISLIKSLDLDRWTQEHVEAIRRQGNAKAREIYEANLPPSEDWKHGNKKEHMSENIALERFIRRKYETREFAGSAPEPKKQVPRERSASVGNKSSAALTSSNSSSALARAPVKAAGSSKDVDPLINFDAAPTVPTGAPAPAAPKGPPTKNDIMQLYNTVLQPAAKPSASAPVPTPISSGSFSSFPAPNYHVSIDKPAPVYAKPAPNYNVTIGTPSYGYPIPISGVPPSAVYVSGGLAYSGAVAPPYGSAGLAYSSGGFPGYAVPGVPYPGAVYPNVTPSLPPGPAGAAGPNPSFASQFNMK